MEEKDLKNTLSLSANRSYSELQRMKVNIEPLFTI